MSELLIYINILSSVFIVWYALNRLTSEKWRLKNPELWVHSILFISSVCIALSNLRGEVHNPFEISFNVGVAAYFATHPRHRYRSRNDS